MTANCGRTFRLTEGNVPHHNFRITLSKSNKNGKKKFAVSYHVKAAVHQGFEKCDVKAVAVVFARGRKALVGKYKAELGDVNLMKYVFTIELLDHHPHKHTKVLRSVEVVPYKKGKTLPKTKDSASVLVPF